MAKSPPLASLKPAARRKRIAVLAANPGTRSAIPDKFLPAKYQAARKTAQRMKQENATLYNPAAILSGNDLRNAVKSEVNLQINPQLGAFDRAISNLGAARDIVGKRVGGYFNLYNTETANAARAIPQTGNDLVQRLAALGQGTQDTLGQIKGDIQNETASDQSLRGAGLQDFSRAQAAVDFNRAQAAGSTNSAVGAAAGQVAGANTLAGTIAAVAPMRAADQQFALAGKFNQQIADMMGKRADVEATRGDLTAKTLNQMRNDQFTNLATMKGLDLKQSDLAETIRSNKAQERLTGRAITQRDIASIRTARTAGEKARADNAFKQAEIDIKRGIDPVTHKPLPKKPESAAAALDRWRLAFARKHGYLPSTGKPGSKGKGKGKDGGPSLTTNEKITQTGKFAPIYNTIKSRVKPDFPGNRQTGGVKAGQEFLKDNPTSDPLYVSVALDMAYDGHVSKQNAEKLHARGLTVKDLGLVSAQDFFKARRNNPRIVGARKGTKKRPAQIGTGAFPPISIP